MISIGKAGLINLTGVELFIETDNGIRRLPIDGWLEVGIKEIEEHDVLLKANLYSLQEVGFRLHIFKPNEHLFTSRYTFKSLRTLLLHLDHRYPERPCYVIIPENLIIPFNIYFYRTLTEFLYKGFIPDGMWFYYPRKHDSSRGIARLTEVLFLREPPPSYTLEELERVRRAVLKEVARAKKILRELRKLTENGHGGTDKNRMD